MAEATLLPLAKSILEKLIDPATSYIAKEIKAAQATKIDLKIIADKLEAICAVLEDAQEKHYANKAIHVWLRDLKGVVYDIDDLLDEVATDALQRGVNKGHLLPQLRYYLSSSNPLISRFHLSHKIRNLREKLEHIVAKKNDFGLSERPVETSTVEIRDPLDVCAYVNKSEIIGRDEAKKDIISKMLAVSDASSLSVLPIVGMGGIGKTALAKLVYDDVTEFDLKLWACVSDKFDLRKIVEDIIKSRTDDSTPNLSLGRLVEKLQNLLNGKKYFLVLDDVWVDDIATWNKLKNMLAIGKVGSVILTTTRNAEVASIVQTNTKSYELDRLPDNICWSIFKELAFVEGEDHKYPELCNIGRSIVEKCGGVPLVAKCLGSLLRSIERDEREWQRINDMDSFTKLHGPYDGVRQLLKLSYDKLPSHLKPCFVHLALFAKDRVLSVIELLVTWIALQRLRPGDGNDEIERYGYACFMGLLSRSLLQEHKFTYDNTMIACKMHDLLHDLARNILGEELAVVTCDELKVTEMSRHIVWEFATLDAPFDKDFTKELLKAKGARTFSFAYQMDHISQSFLEWIISNFTCLRILDLGKCFFNELPKSIGNLKHLRFLDLSGNTIIKSLPNTIGKLLNLESLGLYNCTKLKELPRNVHKLQNLTFLDVTTYQMSLVGTQFNRLSSLRNLVFFSCTRLVSLWEGDAIGHLTSLKQLQIENCPRLACLPNSMKSLVVLHKLNIVNCEELDLEEGEGMHGLQSLRSLLIEGVPKLTRLPNGLQCAATSLQYLFIQDCRGLIELPCWLQSFGSLRKISLYDCPNLMALPKGFDHLISLRELDIDNCPHLSQNCAVPSGEDYPLIRHVPLITLDGRCFPPEQRQ